MISICPLFLGCRAPYLGRLCVTIAAEERLARMSSGVITSWDLLALIAIDKYRGALLDIHCVAATWVPTRETLKHPPTVKVR
jgi:hypothetical protein